MIDWEMEQLMRINWQLENGSLEELEDYQEALNELYECFECYGSIRIEFDDWGLDEDGNIIERNLKEHKLFYFKITQMIYKILIDNAYKELFDINQIIEKEYTEGFKEGIAQAMNGIHEVGL